MSSHNRVRVEVDAARAAAANVKAVELADVGLHRDGVGVVISTDTADVVVTGDPVALVAFARGVLNAAVEILEMEV